VNKKIPVYEPVLNSAVRANVLQCIDLNWISSKGEFIDRFEHQFAQKTGVSHAAGVCNGTVALHLALLALGVSAGDEVIVPTFTYIASVNAIAYVGATPVFVDSRPDTWQMDVEDVARKITPKTRAIMAVHLYGQPCDMPAICELARGAGIAVIEDAAEAFGSRIGGRHVGTWGDVSTYSFFGNKTITTGEGGAVVTNSAELMATIKKLRGQGLAGTREYWHDVIGYNYRMTNICAAIGVGQLEVADELIAKKRQIAAFYRRALGGLPLDFLWEAEGTTSSFWMNTIGLHDGSKRDELRKHLASAGIETRPAFYPAHTLPMYAAYDKGPYSNATRIAAAGINLPSSPALSDADVQRVVGCISEFYSQR
jgi:perosamine synthetase